VVVYAAVQVELVLPGKVLQVVLTSVMALRIILVEAVAVPVVPEPMVLLQLWELAVSVFKVQ
jgi:hypothetical protein